MIPREYQFFYFGKNHPQKERRLAPGRHSHRSSRLRPHPMRLTRKDRPQSENMTIDSYRFYCSDEAIQLYMLY